VALDGYEAELRWIPGGDAEDEPWWQVEYCDWARVGQLSDGVSRRRAVESALFADHFETGTTVAWSLTAP